MSGTDEQEEKFAEAKAEVLSALIQAKKSSYSMLGDSEYHRSPPRLCLSGLRTELVPVRLDVLFTQSVGYLGMLADRCASQSLADSG